MIKVSICVITYNHEAYIRQCLQSLVAQRAPWRFEILVGEDASSDGTRRIVEEFAAAYPELVKPFLRERNLGGVPNYRAVHDAASGEYVCHCDGDDYWAPGKLEQQAGFLDTHPECSAVFTNSFVVSATDERIGVFSVGVAATFDIGYLIRDGNFLHHSSMMYRRRFQPLMFPPQEDFIDFDVYVRLARHGRLGYINRPLTSYREASSASVIRSDNQRIRRLVWKALADVRAHEAPAASIRRADAVFLADAAYHSLRSGRPARYLDWLALVRERPRASLLATQIEAAAVLLRDLVRKLAFHVGVRLGLSTLR